MLNIIWLLLVVSSVVISFFNGTTDAVVASVTANAKLAFEIAFGLGGILIFWLGLMNIAEKAGLIKVLARVLRPILIFLFPDVPAEHPAMGAMVLNMAANMLGLNNAATPFGLRAMEELEKLNPQPGVATNAMCTFLVINTSSVQLIPATAIALLAAGGALEPTAIIITTLLATMCSTVGGVAAVKLLERLPHFRIKDNQAGDV